MLCSSRVTKRFPSSGDAHLPVDVGPELSDKLILRFYKASLDLDPL